MINLIYGANGSGKTQKLIDTSNEELDKTKGLIVYLDWSNNHRLAISKQIRFINVSEFEIYSSDTFIGLLTGLIAGNYDINRIFIDNIHKIINSNSQEDILALLKKIMNICKINDIQCYITINAEDVEEENLKNYNIIEQ